MTNELINIRQAFLSDLDKIVSFNQLMAMETENRALASNTITEGVSALLNDPNKGFYLLAELDGQVVAQTMVTYEWSDWRNGNIWWIQSVYVEKGQRKKGIYKALYQRITSLAITKDVKAIRLYVEKENFAAQRVYERLGMEESHYLMYESEL